MSYLIEKASPADGPALNRFAEAHASGGISLSLSRAPDYFKAFQVEGDVTDVIVIKERATRRLVCTGARSERLCHIDGESRRLGYLSSLRIAPDRRKGTILWRGYEALRAFHEKGRVPAYLCSIFKSNDEAVSILTSGRGPLPGARALGSYLSCIFKPQPGAVESDGFRVRPMRPADCPAVADFLLTYGSRQRQFFPAYSYDDLTGRQGPLLGLDQERVLLLERDGKLAATGALWDQTAFRRWQVPDALAAVGGVKGGDAKVVFLSLLCVAHDDSRVFDSLLRSLLRLARPGEFVLGGFHESDPLLPVARHHAITALESSLYLFYWEDGRSFAENLNIGVPYLEGGSL